MKAAGKGTGEHGPRRIAGTVGRAVLTGVALVGAGGLAAAIGINILRHRMRHGCWRRGPDATGTPRRNSR